MNHPATDPSLPLLSTITGPADLKRLTVEQLPDLADEIRTAICDQVARTGGHLAPNLGVVELTIALHYVFDFGPDDTASKRTSGGGGGGDRLFFDVGHQCYPHKLLTGRLHLLDRLRTRDGMAGFPEPRESDHDLFSVGHAGTAISTAVGMARADDVIAAPASHDPSGASDRRVVALVGDASIVNGVALEGLNNAGTLNRQFLTVLNDNGMSISQPQGALAAYFDKVRISQTYGEVKKTAKQVLGRLPGKSIIEELYHRGSEMIKDAIAHDHMFEHFGHICIGPVDGHDLPTLIEVLHEVKDIGHPVLLHAKTIKGKGYDFAEGDATTFHSPKPFVVEGCRVEVKKSGRSFTAAFSDAMLDVMDRDENVFAVTAAMGPGTGIDKLIEKFPGRTLDTGICESHAMDMCAGMAKAGLKPFFAVYSTFSQRALDQVFQEVTLQGLPVRVCMDRAGYVGGDGAVHHGFMDVAMFRQFPGAVVLAASDEPNLIAGLEFMRQHDAGATFIRYPRDSVAAEPIRDEVPPFELGKAHLAVPARQQGKQRTGDLAILAYGTMLYQARAALDELNQQGYDVALYDARFAKPVDIDLLKELSAAGVPIVTIEDHALTGGFGTCVLEAMNKAGIATSGGGVHRMGHPDRWVYQDTRANQLTEAGLDASSIARKVRGVLNFESDAKSKDAPAGDKLPYGN